MNTRLGELNCYTGRKWENIHWRWHYCRRAETAITAIYTGCFDGWRVLVIARRQMNILHEIGIMFDSDLMSLLTIGVNGSPAELKLESQQTKDDEEFFHRSAIVIVPYTVRNLDHEGSFGKSRFGAKIWCAANAMA